MNEKEITIAYGNEIQLTTTGEKNKQVFLKISPAFRDKQLKELKGATLSVFICYALHSDENGYTWVNDKTIKKETGYSITSEVRQKLIKLGYLYQERLYDKKGRFRDWIYRIFQPVEEGKRFIIRGIEQYTHLPGKKTYIEKNTISGKDGGIIEEEPIKIKEEPNNHVEIQRIYDFFIYTFNKNTNQYKLTPLRRQKIKKRLEDAGEEMLKRAIANTAASPFHRGKNDRGWQADLDFIIRSYEQVEKLANMQVPKKEEEKLDLTRSSANPLYRQWLIEGAKEDFEDWVKKRY